MTERLYYTDAYLREFESAVRAIHSLEGNRSAVILDRTAFYPTSGGQPFDLGTLDDLPVVDVQDRDDRVVHVVEGRPGAARVRGRIDWPRRFDHMQQHTGQHMLSAAFDRLAAAATVSFHLGATASTIDLARDVSPTEIAEAEADANAVVWEDRPVLVRFVEDDEAGRLPLRKPPARGGRLRIVEIEGYDLSACGGTHVARTGAVGLIAVSGWERFKGGTRVEFVCGRRALVSHGTLRDVVRASVRLLSVLPPEIPEAVGKLQAEAREGARSVKELQVRLASLQADALALEAEVVGGSRLVMRFVEGWDAAALKSMAGALASRAGHGTVLFSSGPAAGVIVARASDVDVDSAAVLRALISEFGGKGGGRPELAQGGGLRGDPAAMLASARRAWERAGHEPS